MPAASAASRSLTSAAAVSAITGSVSPPGRRRSARVAVASGRIDGYVELHINLWDVAAALCILEEAGAVVSPFLEGDGLTQGNPIRATAPGVAAALTEIAGF